MATVNGYPYPLQSDPVDVAQHIEDLARALPATVTGKGSTTVPLLREYNQVGAAPYTLPAGRTWTGGVFTITGHGGNVGWNMLNFRTTVSGGQAHFSFYNVSGAVAPAMTISIDYIIWDA
jgi:hypothetical protein